MEFRGTITYTYFMISKNSGVEKYQAIIFDFYGVICAEISPFWFRDHFESTEAAEKHEHYSQLVDLGDLTFADFTSQLSTITGIKPEAISDDFNQRAHINAPLVSLMKDLKTNYSLALCSNGASEFTRGVINANGLDKLFDFIGISAELNLVKPDPAFFKKVLRDLDVAAEQAIFIDDRAVNVRAADALGLTALVYKSVDELKNELEALGVRLYN
jgi:HAD superfamily hydrolase (TIGR01509 family)